MNRVKSIESEAEWMKYGSWYEVDTVNGFFSSWVIDVYNNLL